MPIFSLGATVQATGVALVMQDAPSILAQRPLRPGDCCMTDNSWCRPGLGLMVCAELNVECLRVEHQFVLLNAVSLGSLGSRYTE